jgi:hypothetical protein
MARGGVADKVQGHDAQAHSARAAGQPTRIRTFRSPNKKRCDTLSGTAPIRASRSSVKTLLKLFSVRPVD